MPQASEPYVSPRMAKIQSIRQSAVSTQPEPAPSGFPKATSEGFGREGPPRSSVAKNQRQLGTRVEKPAAAKPPITEEAKIPSSDLIEGLKSMAEKKGVPVKSLDQFEEQYKGRIDSETSSTVDPALLLKKIGAEGVIPRDKVAGIEKA